MIVVRALRQTRRLAVLWMLMPLGVLALPLWAWPIPDWRALIGTVVGFTFAFWAGAAAMAAAIAPDARQFDQRLPPAGAGDGWGMRAAFVLAILINIASLFARASFNPFNCGDIFTCSNAAYQGYAEGVQGGAGAIVEYLRIVTSPILYGVLGLAIWNLAAGRGGPTLLFVGVIATEAVVAMATGTARNLANLLLFAGFALFLARLLRPPGARRRSGWATLVMATLGILFFLYFAAIQLGRDGAVAVVGLQPFGNGYIESLSHQLDSDNFVLKGFESLARYLAQGYFVLAQVLDMPMGDSFPFGHSIFLARRGGDEAYISASLPGRLESATGWSRQMAWHSIYPWLMSDFGYVGTAIWMAIFGALFALAVFVALTRADVLSKLPLFLMFLLVLYVPANNQLAQNAETTVAFVVMALILLVRGVGLIASRRGAPVLLASAA